MPTEPPNQEPASAPLQAPSVAAVVVQGVSTTMMMMMVVLEQEEGAVMQEGAPSPSLRPSLSAVTTHRFAYNSALQNDL